MQFFATMLLYIIKFVLFTNSKAIVFWLPLNFSKSLNIKNKNRISDRGNLCGILIGVGVKLLLYFLNTILIVCFVKKA